MRGVRETPQSFTLSPSLKLLNEGLGSFPKTAVQVVRGAPGSAHGTLLPHGPHLLLGIFKLLDSPSQAPEATSLPLSAVLPLGCSGPFLGSVKGLHSAVSLEQVTWRPGQLWPS